MKYFVYVDGERLEVEFSNGAVRVEGEPVRLELGPQGASPVRSALLGGRSVRVLPQRNGRGEWTLDVEGIRYRAEVLDPGQEAIREARQAVGGPAGPAPLLAPMPGLVVRVEVEVGQRVKAGEGIVIMEAMKMENELKAPADAVVRAVHAAAGSPVDKDQVLVEFEGPEEEG